MQSKDRLHEELSGFTSLAQGHRRLRFGFGRRAENHRPAIQSRHVNARSARAGGVSTAAMRARMQWQVKEAMKPRPSLTPMRSRLLQRKCACGGTAGPSGECEECRKKRLSLQRKTLNSELGSHKGSS